MKAYKRCSAGRDITSRRGSCPPPQGRVSPRSIKEIVRDYIDRYRANADREIAFFRKMHSIEEAIEKAAKAECETGGKHDHQWRIPPSILGRAAKALLDNRAEIRKCRSFENLMKLVETTIGRIPGIGEMAIYDTAHRIGANMGLYPERIYLHRGTRDGAKALGLGSSRAYLNVSELPREFERLRPREIEDCLCIYKNALLRIQQGI